MPLGKGALALWSSSYGKRRRGEKCPAAWWREKGDRVRGCEERREAEKEETRRLKKKKRGEGRRRKEERGGEEGNVGSGALALFDEMKVRRE